MHKLSREERETHIWFTDADDGLTVETFSPVTVRKVRKIAEAHGAEVKELMYGGVSVDLPKTALSLRKPRPKMSEEQRQEAAERLKAWRDVRAQDVR